MNIGMILVGVAIIVSIILIALTGGDGGSEPNDHYDPEDRRVP